MRLCELTVEVLVVFYKYKNETAFKQINFFSEKNLLFHEEHLTTFLVKLRELANCFFGDKNVIDVVKVPCLQL